MLNFPEGPYDSIADYTVDYARQVAEAFASIDGGRMQAAADCLEQAIGQGAHIFTCGNGGSASISNHFVCDYTKGTRANTTIRPHVHSLVSNIELTTAIANDFAYDQVFSFQIESYGKSGDVLVAVSSSGSSPNIIRAIERARDIGMTTIAMVGFAGGKAKTLADIPLHVESGNYGVVEDVHQAMMHILAQYVRQRHFNDRDLVKERVF